MSDTGETPSQINYPLHRLLKRLLNCNLPEIVIIPSVIEHKGERARSISICARINNGSLVIASIKKKKKPCRLYDSEVGRGVRDKEQVLYPASRRVCSAAF